MISMKKQLLMLAILMTSPISAHAQADGAHGGDTLALEFIASAQNAIEFVDLFPKEFPALANLDLDETLSSALIIIVDKPLPVAVDQSTQESTATNSMKPDIIRINRKRWKQTHNILIREALALHEVLSLKGLESTGNYRYSEHFLKLQGNSETFETIYHQVTPELRVSQNISGSYRGSITRQDNRAEIGSIQIDIWPQEIIVSDHSSDTAPKFQGKVTITNSTTSIAMIQEGQFFPSSNSNGTFNGTIIVRIPETFQLVTMSISGSPSGNKFNGQISIQSTASIVGVFSTVKNAGVSAPSSPSQDQSPQTFNGSVDDIGATVTMGIIKSPSSEEQNFIDNFTLQKTLNVALTFNIGGTETTPITFQNAIFDQQNGSIRAVATINDILVRLDCNIVEVNQNSWLCIYMSTLNNKPRHFQVTEQK